MSLWISHIILSFFIWIFKKYWWCSKGSNKGEGMLRLCADFGQLINERNCLVDQLSTKSSIRRQSELNKWSQISTMHNPFSFLSIVFSIVMPLNKKSFLILLLLSLIVLLKDSMELYLPMDKQPLEKLIQWKVILEIKYLKVQVSFQGWLSEYLKLFLKVQSIFSFDLKSHSLNFIWKN